MMSRIVTQTGVPPTTAPGSMTLFEKIGYGFGDAGGTIITGLISNFLTFFYTDVFGLTPALVGTLFVVLRVVDAVSDPMIGIVADRTFTRWGQFRPYLLWTAVPLGLIGFLTFVVPDIAYHWKVVYAIATYFLLSLLYSLNNVPYCALISKITNNPREVVSCQSFRFALSGGAGFAVAVGLPYMVTHLGGANVARGYALGVGILCSLAVLMSLLCFFSVRERNHNEPGHKFVIRENLANIRKNDQLILTFFMSLLLIGIFNTKGGAAMYFITYVLHGNAGYTSMFFGLATFGGILGSIIVQFFTRRFEVKNIYFAVNILLAISHFAVYFVPGAYPTCWLALVFICCVTLGFTLPLHFTMVAFADDYGEWKSGVRSSGMNFAFNLFFVKLAWALAGSIISITLVIIAYQAGVQNQTPLSLKGITLLSTVIPGVLHLLLALTVSRFKIDNRMVKQMAVELKK